LLNKRKICTVFGVCASLLFSLCYFVIFAGIDSEPHISVIQEEKPKSQTPLTLYWIQLGVFKEESSYTSLVLNCETAGLELVQVQDDDKVILVAQCCLDKNIRQQGLEKLKGITEDYLLKEKRIEEDEALLLLKENDFKTVLEEFVYQ